MNIFEYPLINPLKIFPRHSFPGNTNPLLTQPTFNDNYNTTPFDSYWYAERLKEWEFNVKYFQKYQKGDSIKLQWKSETNSNPSDFLVYVLDCNGDEVQAYLTPEVVIVASENYYSIDIPLWHLEEGYYFVQILHVESYTYFISEPIDLKEIHKDSLCIEYWNSYNSHNVLFEQTQIRFKLRVDAYVSELQPDSKREVYEDQPLNMVLLSGRPYRTWQLSVGDNGYGVSEYMADKISRAFDCDNTKLDANYYTALSDSKLEPNRIAGYPLPSWKMSLRDRYNNDSISVSDLGYYNLGEIPLTDRFYVRAFQYTIPASPSPATIDIVFERDFTGARNFADFLNNSFDLFSTNGFDIEGDFSINDANELIYTYSSQTEKDYWLNGTPTPIIDGILPYWNTLDVRSVTGSLSQLDVTFVGAGNRAAIYGDGNVALYGSGNLSHNYGNIGVATAYIYYDTQTEIEIKNGGDYQILSLGGQVSPLLTHLSSPSEIIKEITNDLFTFANGAFANLDLQDNKLSVTQIDKLIMMIQEANRTKKLSTGGVININSQTPSAPPSAGTVSNLVSLISQNLTINTD